MLKFLFGIIKGNSVEIVNYRWYLFDLKKTFCGADDRWGGTKMTEESRTTCLLYVERLNEKERQLRRKIV